MNGSVKESSTPSIAEKNNWIKGTVPKQEQTWKTGTPPKSEAFQHSDNKSDTINDSDDFVFDDPSR